MKSGKMLFAVAGMMVSILAVDASTHAASAQSSSSARPQTTASDVAPSVRNRTVPEKFQRRKVRFATNEAPGTIIVDTNNKFLYYVEGNNRATRYGIGVGREGFGWSGVVSIGRKSEWPTWTPPAEMRAREARRGIKLPVVMQGGPENPLGARAMYLGSSLYRIHGSNEPDTIGQAVSSGCIRMTNDDVTDLYERAKVGSRVMVMR